MRLIPWMRGDRTAALSALALAAGAREALPEAFTRLAAEDPLLRPWIARLVPGLRAGMPLAEVLRRARALDRDEAAELAVAADPAEALGRLAAGSGQAPPGYLFIRWYPAWAFTVIAGLAWLGGLTVIAWFTNIFVQLGIKMPAPTMMLIAVSERGWQWIPVVWLGLLAIAWVPGLRQVLHLWSPEVHRTAAWWRLVRAARQERLRRRQPWWRLTGPEADWSTWWLLSRWRCPPALRDGLFAWGLEERLRRLGVPHLDAAGHPEWDLTEQEASKRFADAVAGSWVQVTWPVQIILLSGFAVLALMFPFVSMWWW